MRGKAAIIKILGGWAVLILLVSLCDSCRRSPREEKAATKIPSPLNISIELIPGIETEASVVVLRIFSRAQQQKALNKKNNERIEPLEIEINRKLWTANIAFQLVSAEGEVNYLERDKISLLLAPKSERLEFTEQKVYQVFYIIEPSSCLSPPSRLVAQLDICQYRLISNAITIPPWPTKKFEAALRQARVNLFLNPDQLLESATTLIKEDPGSYLGYWYRGLALEKRKKYQQALESFKMALQLYPKSTRNDHREPPALIIQKIKQLSLTSPKEGTSSGGK
jgi:tetratricopeptide (TPR) repeat protein